MATFYPITMDELQNIPGVGAGKAARYGQKFLEVIRRHVEENDIERPADIRVRTRPDKSKLKINIIQQIDRKVALAISRLLLVLTSTSSSARSKLRLLGYPH